MDLPTSETWISTLLAPLPDEKLAAGLRDDHPQWEYIDGEIVKLGSLTHSQLDIAEIQRQGLALLSTESKDFRLVAHLLRTLQHAGNHLLALKMLTQYVAQYWSVAAPQNMVHKKRLAAQIIKRFGTGIGSVAQKLDTLQRETLLGEIAKLAQLWQENGLPELAQSTDNLFGLYQRAFQDTAQTTADKVPSSSASPLSQAGVGGHVAPPTSTPIPAVDIDSHDDKAWRNTLLKIADILCERQPDSPLGYRLRRHAIWQGISNAPLAESDGRTPMAAFSADRMANYQSRANNADMTLWQEVEHSLILAPYWFDGHALSAQIAEHLGHTAVAGAIRDEVNHFLQRLPHLSPMLFSDRTPFFSEQTLRWLKQAKGGQSLYQTTPSDNLPEVWRRFDEQGLEAALQYLEGLPIGEPRDRFYRQYLGAQLMERAGMTRLAQQHYQMLFQAGLRITLADWEPVLLEQLEEKFMAEQ